MSKNNDDKLTILLLLFISSERFASASNGWQQQQLKDEAISRNTSLSITGPDEGPECQNLY